MLLKLLRKHVPRTAAISLCVRHLSPATEKSKTNVPAISVKCAHPKTTK